MFPIICRMTLEMSLERWKVFLDSLSKNNKTTFSQCVLSLFVSAQGGVVFKLLKSFFVRFIITPKRAFYNSESILMP